MPEAILNGRDVYNGVELREEADAWHTSQLELLQERITELELAQEDVGWLRMGSEEMEFDREGLRRITSVCRFYFLRNPLINRAVMAQTYYVMAQGLSWRAKDARIQGVIDGFMEHSKNKTELTSHEARELKEQTLQVNGNLFFAFFSNLQTGRVTIRSIPFDEIVDTYTNPDDRRDVWFYRRTWNERTIEGSSTPIVKQRTAWYPDFRHLGPLPASLGQDPVINTPIYHVKVGGLDSMKFGLSEVYQAIDWSRGYTQFLTDWATLVKALSKFAWRLTTKGSVAARNSAAALMARDPETGTEPNRNAGRPTAGSTAVLGNGSTLDAIPKTGATVSAEDGRRLLLMVAAATGLPETFFGDVSVGTLATATSLDRPTELKFLSRQNLWTDIHETIFGYVIDRWIEASGEGFFQVEDEATGEGRWVLSPGEPAPGQEPDEEGDRKVDVTWPPILEHDIAAAVTAVVTAATLNGSALSDATMTPEQVSRLLFDALQVDNVEAWIDEVFPVDDQGKPVLRDDQVQREELQAKADAQKLAIAGRVAPPVDNPGIAPQNAQEAAEFLQRWAAEMRTIVESLTAR